MRQPVAKTKDDKKQERPLVSPVLRLPTTNYTLSTVCPACNALVIRRACKVRCEHCGFLWDCSEL